MRCKDNAKLWLHVAVKTANISASCGTCMVGCSPVRAAQVSPPLRAVAADASAKGLLQCLRTSACVWLFTDMFSKSGKSGKSSKSWLKVIARLTRAIWGGLLSCSAITSCRGGVTNGSTGHVMLPGLPPFLLPQELLLLLWLQLLLLLLVTAL